MKSNSLALFIFLMATVVPTASAQNPVDPNAVVAVIDGNEIKGGEYFHRMERLPGVGTLVGQNFIQLQPGVLTLQQLISEHLLLQLAEQRGVSPKDSEVDQAYRDALTENPNLEKTWTAGGLSLDELRYQFKLDLAKFKIVTQGVNITDQEVQNQYDTNHSDYTVPRLVKLRFIVADGEAGKTAIDADLAAGKAFGQVAHDRSIDVSRVRDGDYGNVPFNSLAQPIKDALAKVKVGGVTDWVSVATRKDGTGVAIMKFLYEDVTPEKLLPLDDILKNRIRKDMMVKRGSVKNNIAVLMAEARHKAKIDIKDPVFATAFSNLLKQESSDGGAAPAAPVAGGQKSGN
jgi:parvulin-like peptidyl-prolyl isomerase